MKVGIIDIGSNSVRLMLAEDGRTLSKAVATARLGEGLAFTGELKAERMQLATSLIKGYVDEARGANAERVYIFATEAVRVAKNRDVFLAMVRSATGIDIDVVPSDTEALLGFRGAYSGDGTIAVVDIGGASTEIIVGDREHIYYAKSLPIGCVRMRDRCGENDTLLAQYIGDMLERYGDIPPVTKAIFLAGSASTVVTMHLALPQYDVTKVDGACITISDIESLLALFRATPLDERDSIVGLDEGRRDLMYNAMTFIKAILEKLHLDRFYFSDRDNLEGYLVHISERGIL